MDRIFLLNWDSQRHSEYGFDVPPHPVTVTTRIITCFVGNPYEPSFVTVTGWGVTVTGWGVDLMYGVFTYIYSLNYPNVGR